MGAKKKIKEQAPPTVQTDYEKVNNEDDVDLGAAAIIVPPDGGYGWVIVFASFLANMVVDGIIFTVGQGFQPAWVKDFPGTSEGSAAWIVSLLSGWYLLVGPIASALVNIFGCRQVCIGGTLLSFLGFLLSCFAPSVGFLYVTFGIMGGIGFGFIFLPAVVIVSYYFEKRRATATGISLCGSGIGTFVFAPFIKFLLDSYGHWSQALLIITGITLNCLICGALFRPLKPTKKQMMTLEEKLKAIDDEQEVADMIASAPSKIGVLNGDSSAVVTTTTNKLRPAYAEEPEVVTKETTSLLAANVPFERFGGDAPGGGGQQLVVHQIGGQPTAADSGLRKRTVSDRSFRSLFEINKAVAEEKTVGEVNVGHRTRGTSLSIRVDGAEGESAAAVYSKMSREGVNVLNRPLSRQDIFYSGSVKNLPEFKSAPDVPHYIASTLSIHTLVDQTTTDGGAPVAVSGGVKETIKATIRSMLDVTLLKDPSFLILAFSGFFTLTGFFVPFIYLPRQAMAVGHSEGSSTFLVSILGMTNIVARILCGWLSDLPQVNALMLNNVALIFAGLATVLLPHLQAYWMLCIYCVVFGTGTACFASLRSIICVELLGLEKLTNAFGLLLLFMGLASLVGSPIAGMLYDATGSFKLSFYVMGSLITLSGAMGIPLYIMSKVKQRQRNQKAKTELHAPDLVVDEATELTSMPRVQIPERVLEADEELENVA